MTRAYGTKPLVIKAAYLAWPSSLGLAFLLANRDVEA